LAADAGCPSAADDHVDRAVQVERFRHVVLPMLAPDLRATGEALLERVATVGEQALCHGDLVTEHVLAREGRLSGVIEWAGARVTDPALDLAWALNATSPDFADAVASGVDADSRARARDWWALAPWHAVHRVAARSEAAEAAEPWDAREAGEAGEAGEPGEPGEGEPATVWRGLDAVVTRLVWWRDA
jgi:aminoglycoside phosphotransferase (APT) family kinase protein